MRETRNDSRYGEKYDSPVKNAKRKDQSDYVALVKLFLSLIITGVIITVITVWFDSIVAIEDDQTRVIVKILFVLAGVMLVILVNLYIDIWRQPTRTYVKLNFDDLSEKIETKGRDLVDTVRWALNVSSSKLLEDGKLWNQLSRIVTSYGNIILSEHHATFKSVARQNINHCAQEMESLERGVLKVSMQPRLDLDPRWRDVIGEAEPGQLVFATSTVSAQWWKNNSSWYKLNKEAIEKGVIIVRIFVFKDENEFRNSEKLLEIMRGQASDGIQTNVLFRQNIPGGRVRDMALLGSSLKGDPDDLHHPKNEGKELVGGALVSELILAEGKDEWIGWGLYDTGIELEHARRDMEAYYKASTRFEDNLWYSSFFSEEYRRTILVPREEESARQVSWICDVLELKTNDLVLDLGCGHGNTSIPLISGKKCICYGLDLNTRLLNEARKRLPQHSEFRKQFLCGDMKDLTKVVTSKEAGTVKSVGSLKELAQLRNKEFAAVLSIFTSFGYFLKEEENSQVVEGVFRILKPGGKFLLDLDNLDFFVAKTSKRSRGHEEFSDKTHNLTIMRWDALDAARRRRLTQFVAKNGRTVRSWPLVSVELYGREDIENLLQNLGFHNIDIYGDLKGGEWDKFESERMVVVAEKPELDSRAA